MTSSVATGRRCHHASSPHSIVTLVAPAAAIVVTVVAAVAAAIVVTVVAAVAAVVTVIAAAAIVVTVVAAAAIVVTVVAAAAVVVVAAVAAAVVVVVASATAIVSATAVVVAATAAAAARGLGLAAPEARALGAKDRGVATRACPVTGAIAAALGSRNDDLGANLATHVRPPVVLLGCVGRITRVTVGQKREALVLATITHGKLNVLQFAVLAKVLAQVVLLRIEGQTAQEELAPVLVSCC